VLKKLLAGYKSAATPARPFALNNSITKIKSKCKDNFFQQAWEKMARK